MLFRQNFSVILSRWTSPLLSQSKDVAAHGNGREVETETGATTGGHWVCGEAFLTRSSTGPSGTRCRKARSGQREQTGRPKEGRKAAVDTRTRMWDNTGTLGIQREGSGARLSRDWSGKGPSPVQWVAEVTGSDPSHTLALPHWWDWGAHRPLRTVASASEQQGRPFRKRTAYCCPVSAGAPTGVLVAAAPGARVPGLSVSWERERTLTQRPEGKAMEGLTGDGVVLPWTFPWCVGEFPPVSPCWASVPPWLLSYVEGLKGGLLSEIIHPYDSTVTLAQRVWFLKSCLNYGLFLQWGKQVSLFLLFKQKQIVLCVLLFRPHPWHLAGKNPQILSWVS